MEHTSSTEPAGFMLLTGAASVDLCNSCSMSLACSFSDWIWFSWYKSCLLRVIRNPNTAVSLLTCHYTMKERWSRRFFPRLHTSRATTTLHVVSFINFYFHFPKNSRPKLRPICSLYLLILWNRMWHKQWAWVTSDLACYEGFKKVTKALMKKEETLAAHVLPNFTAPKTPWKVSKSIEM